MGKTEYGKNLNLKCWIDMKWRHLIQANIFQIILGEKVDSIL